jgi:hypothetical protein
LANGVFSAAWLPFLLVLFFGHTKKRMGSPQGLPVVVVFEKIGGQAKKRLLALLAKVKSGLDPFP